MNKYHYRNPWSGVVTGSLWYMSHDRVTEPVRAGATEGRSRGAGGVVLGEVEGVPEGEGGRKDRFLTRIDPQQTRITLPQAHLPGYYVRELLLT